MPRKKTLPSVWTALSYEEWQQNTSSRRYAIDLSNNTDFQRMLTVLENERPTGFPDRYTVIDTGQGMIELGRRAGYDTCLSMLKLMLAGRLDAPPEQQEPMDYTNSETETE